MQRNKADWKTHTMSRCGLRARSTTDCGCSVHFPDEKTFVKLGSCKRNIRTHLSSLQLNPDDVLSEGQLIARRNGFFSNWHDIDICPKHRYDSGLYWKPSRACRHPNHVGNSKPYRNINSPTSFIIWQTTGSVVPVGSGICRNCKKGIPPIEKATEVLQFLDRNDDFAMKDDNSQRLETAQKVSEELSAELSQESAQFSESQVSNWSDDIPVSIREINSSLEVLSKGSVSPLKFRLNKSIEDVDDSTRRLFKRKAEESVHALLNSMAPGQSTCLLKMITDTKSTDAKNEEDIINLIIDLYNEADDNSTRIQLLSLISSKFSKQKLQNLIPGLTVWRIDASRQHAYRHGPGKTVEIARKNSHRSRMDKVKLEHALGFFFNPSFIHISSYGSKEVLLDSGSSIQIPEVVRSSCNSVFVDMYEKYCKETGFMPLSTSTLYKILSSCASVKKTNLRGLDNTAADGAVAFESLSNIVEKYGKNGTLTKDDVDDYNNQIKSSKLYLKTDFKLHLQPKSECANHCITFALSDSSDSLLRSTCDHPHLLDCDRCSMISRLPESLKEFITNSQLTEDEKHEDRLEVDVAGAKISEWQCHIVRTINQDEARLSMLETLSFEHMVIVMDWAMKFLPAFHREKMTDFYGQKGMNWHVSVGIFRAEDSSIKHKTFVHIFDSVKQDWYAVASILENLLFEVKSMFPSVKTISLRSDNAGAYHCGHLWQAIPSISERTGLKIVRYDYSEPQSGKSYCDAKIAHMRCKMRMHVAAGGNIVNAKDMKRALESGKGVTGVKVMVAEVDTSKQTLHNHKWKNVSFYNNLKFIDGDVKLWKAYNIGSGIKLHRKEVKKLSVIQKKTGLIIHEQSGQETSFGSISTGEHVTTESSNTLSHTAQVESREINSFFVCPENGCVKEYQKVSSLESHILYGRHTYQLEVLSTYDQIKLKWAEVCQNMSESSRRCLTISNCSSQNVEKVLLEGWALKKQRKSARFSEKVKAYLRNLYEIGQKKGKKISPADAATQLKQLRNEDGTKMFSPEEYLQTSQIASFFKRLTVKSCKGIETENIDDNEMEGLMLYIEQEEVRREFV